MFGAVIGEGKVGLGPERILLEFSNMNPNDDSLRSDESLNESRGDEGEDGGGAIREILRDKWRDVLFSGWYADRILWDEDRGLYRDRLVIDACETAVIRQGKSLYRKLRRRIPEGQVCGMAKNDDSLISIFVDWPPGHQALGHFWFLIQDASFSPEFGVIWRVKVVRSVLASDQSGSNPCPHCGKLPYQNAGSCNTDEPMSSSEIYRQLLSQINSAFRPGEWVEEARPYLTLTSLINGFKFVMVLLMTMATGLINILPQMAHHLNNLILSLSQLLKQATPFLLGCLDMVSKIVGGFYLLIAMIWRDARQPADPRPSMPVRALNGPRVPPRRPYTPPSSYERLARMQPNPRFSEVS